MALRGVTGVFSGTGSSKKSAQEEAASQILDSMRTQGQMNDEEVWKTWLRSDFKACIVDDPPSWRLLNGRFQVAAHDKLLEVARADRDQGEQVQADTVAVPQNAAQGPGVGAADQG